MTAYNPAIVALNNMLREQIRLVEQFVEINQRMYESYSTGVNSSYRYTTLEDTQQVSGKHPRRKKYAPDCPCVRVWKTGLGFPKFSPFLVQSAQLGWFGG